MKTFRSAFIRPTCELSKRTFSLRYSSPRQMFTEPFIKRAILLLENPFTFRGSAFSSKQIVDRWKSLKLLSILSIRFYNWKSKRRETLMNSFQLATFEGRSMVYLSLVDILDTVFSFFPSTSSRIFLLFPRHDRAIISAGISQRGSVLSPI